MKHKIEIVFDTEIDPITAGIRMNWVDGDNGSSKINLSCLATDEQIVEFINNLNDNQWKAIATNPLFNPLAQAILEREVEVQEEVEVK